MRAVECPIVLCWPTQVTITAEELPSLPALQNLEIAATHPLEADMRFMEAVHVSELVKQMGSDRMQQSARESDAWDNHGLRHGGGTRTGSMGIEHRYCVQELLFIIMPST